MVEFFDPLANKNISYHIAPVLIRKWQGLRDGGLEKLNEDRIYLVDGREGTGKSSFAFQQAKYIDPKFNVDYICFEPKGFLHLLRTAEKGRAIVFDEAFRGLSSKGSRSKVNKEIVQALMEVRQRNLVIFIVLPTIFLLEIYAAVFRSEGLLHVYKLKKRNSKGQRLRGFKVYNYEKKKILYLRGRAKYFSYSQPIIKKAKGEFYVKKNDLYPTGIPYETFELAKYIAKKDEAFKGSELEEQTEDSKYMLMYYNLLYAFRKELNLSEVETSKRLSNYNVQVSATNVGDICRKIAQTTRHPTPTLYNNNRYKSDEGGDDDGE